MIDERTKLQNVRDEVVQASEHYGDFILSRGLFSLKHFLNFRSLVIKYINQRK